MQDLTAKRTLVKSPPELWEELSEVERLAKHLGAFGEIKITKLEPEHKVAWEGEHARGTVSIEPSGWGTKVILTAELEANGDPPDAPEAGAPAAAETTNEVTVSDGEAGEVEEPVADAEPAPDTSTEPEPTLTTATPEPTRRRRRGFWSRLFAGWLVPQERLGKETPAAEPKVEVAPAPPVEETPEIAPEPAAREPAEEEPAAGGEKSAEEEPAADVDASAEDAPASDVDASAEATAGVATVVEPAPGIDSEHARSVLEETLDALGSAHHRPYSRG
jgi:hypothetical protein